MIGRYIFLTSFFLGLTAPALRAQDTTSTDIAVSSATATDDRMRNEPLSHNSLTGKTVNRHVYFDLDIAHLQYKRDADSEGANPYTAFPFLIRADITRNLQFRLGSETVILQTQPDSAPGYYKNTNLADSSAGLKYIFDCPGSFGMATTGMITMPTGSAAKTDGGLEGYGDIIGTYDLGEWSVGATVGAGYLHFPTKNYWQPAYSFWTEKDVTENDTLSLTYSFEPDTIPEAAAPVERIFFGYIHDCSDSFSLEFNIGRDINAGGADAILTAGFSWRVI